MSQFDESTVLREASLRQIFDANDGALIYKWEHCFDIYEKHFARFRGRECVVLEIGIQHGGSLGLWRDYFGPKCVVYGIDKNPECAKLEGDRVNVRIGSQADERFLDELCADMPRPDIIIDDGSHRVSHQRASFQRLFYHLKDDGIYLVEDTHSSYQLYCGGGLRRRGTFAEYRKILADDLSWFHFEKKKKLSQTRGLHPLRKCL